MLLISIEAAVVAVTSLWALPFLRSRHPSFGLVECTMYGKARPVENVLRFVRCVEKMLTVSGVVFGLLAR